MFNAYQNNITNIKLTAIDKNYELKIENYNLELKTKKGKTKIVEFKVTNIGVYACNV